MSLGGRIQRTVSSGLVLATSFDAGGQHGQDVFDGLVHLQGLATATVGMALPA